MNASMNHQRITASKVFATKFALMAFLCRMPGLNVILQVAPLPEWSVIENNLLKFN